MSLEKAIMDFKTSLNSDGILTRYDQIALLDVFDVIEKEIVNINKRISDIEVLLIRVG